MADGSVSTLTNPVTGTGTTNYVPKWTSGSAIGNSQIFDNGTNVGIGTTSPAYKLDVSGIGNFSNGFSGPSSETGYRLKFYDNGGTHNDAGIGLDGTAGGGEQMWFNALGGFYWGLGTGGTKMRLDSNGNVGIGTTSPSNKLEVVGGVTIGTSASSTVNLYLTRTNAGIAADANYFVSANNTPNQTWIEGGYYIGELSGVVTAPNSGYPYIETYSGQGGSTTKSFGFINKTSGSFTSADVFITMSLLRTGRVTFNKYGAGTFTGTATQRLAVDASGNVIEIPIGSGPVDGNGTANFVTKWSDADTITNSQIFDNGTSVGVGTTSPTEFFHIRSTGFATPLYIEHTAATSAYLGIANSGGRAYIYSSSNDLVFGTTASVTERMRITSAGNVGIGTTSPAVSLQVNASTAAIRLEETSASAKRLEFSIDSSAVAKISANQSAQSIAFETVGSERMRITDAGNVGIGTTTPSSGFGGTIANVKLALRNGTVGANGGTSVILIGGDNNHYSSITAEHTGGGDTYLSFGTSTGAVNPSEKMRITSGGNVGIGTTSPVVKTHIVGPTLTTTSETTYPLWLSDTGDTTKALILGFDLANDVGVIQAVDQAVAWKDVCIAPTAAAVGIGNLTPSQKLHVTGNVRVTGAYYDSNNEAGTSGQVLTSTGSGTDWKSLSEITGVDGTGTANYVAKWSDTDTIANSQIRDDGTTVGIGTAPAAAKLTVNGPVNVGGRYLYNNSQAALDTTGVNVAGLSASTNGDSAFFTFEAGAGDGQYQRIVYSCYNAGGTWNVVKVIDEGTNRFDVVASASSGSTITFTWKSRSGIIYYTPRLIITGVGSIDTTYL
jgi:hypothetical protein